MRKKIERERIISTDVGTLIAPPSNWIVNKYRGWRTPSCLEWMQLFARSCDLLSRVNCRQNYLIIAFLLAGSQCRAARCLDDDNVWEKMQFLTFPNRASLNKSLFPSSVLSWVYGSCFYFGSRLSISLILGPGSHCNVTLGNPRISWLHYTPCLVSSYWLRSLAHLKKN